MTGAAPGRHSTGARWLRRATLRGTRREDGSATVLVLVLVGVLTVAAMAGVVVGGILVGHRRAAAAADLAALAAAEQLAAPSEQPGGSRSEACAAADRTARANDARLVLCRPGGGEGAHDVVVSVEVDVRGPGALAWQVPGRARAGPVSPTADPSVG